MVITFEELFNVIDRYEEHKMNGLIKDYNLEYNNDKERLIINILLVNPSITYTVIFTSEYDSKNGGYVVK